MVLSRRLREAAALVTPGNRLADIGTDHGFVPIFLVEEGKIPSAVAMDVNPGPLQRAREHIKEHGLEDRIRTRLSDGLSALGEKEADTILIAGMGGALSVRILEQGADCVLQEVKELVLQPQSEISFCPKVSGAFRMEDHAGEDGSGRGKVLSDDEMRSRQHAAGRYEGQIRAVPDAG